MNKLIILIGLVNISVFGQIRIDPKIDSLKILKLQFKSIDTLTSDELQNKITVYKKNLKIAENFNVSGIKDSTIFYLEKAHKIFPNDYNLKELRRSINSSNSIDDSVLCRITETSLIQQAILEKATVTAEAGYYTEALKIMLEHYGYDPNYMIQQRKKILEIIELTEK